MATAPVRMARNGRVRRVHPRLAICPVVIALVASACTVGGGGGRDTSTTVAAVWGSGALDFYQGLAAAYRGGDAYDILDFYHPSAEMETGRGDNTRPAPIASVLQWNSGDLAVTYDGVFVGTNEALVTARWEQSGDVGAVVSSVEDGRIGGEVVFELAQSLVEGLEATPEVADAYIDLAVAYAAARSAGDADGVAALYAPDAQVTDVLGGDRGSDEGTGPDQAETWRLEDAGSVLVSVPDESGQAVLLGPSVYGSDPGRAIGIFRVTRADGCDRLVAVRWDVAAGRITHEARFDDVVTSRSCADLVDVDGWWTALALPTPVDAEVSETLTTPAGGAIAIHNGTPGLVELLSWGLGRFASAGIAEPAVDDVVFEPSRSCGGLSGRVIEDAASRRLYVCLYEWELCPLLSTCEVPATRARLAMVHELAHAWMIDRVDEDTKDAFMGSWGIDAWNDPGDSWPDRGVEVAADVIAWGLIDDDLSMVRIGSPACDLLAAGYAVLTGGESVVRTCG